MWSMACHCDHSYHLTWNRSGAAPHQPNRTRKSRKRHKIFKSKSLAQLTRFWQWVRITKMNEWTTLTCANRSNVLAAGKTFFDKRLRFFPFDTVVAVVTTVLVPLPFVIIFSLCEPPIDVDAFLCDLLLLCIATRCHWSSDIRTITTFRPKTILTVHPIRLARFQTVCCPTLGAHVARNETKNRMENRKHR